MMLRIALWLIPAALCAQSGLFLPGGIYVANAASGVRPLTEATGLATGSLADVNLQGIAEQLPAEGVELRLLAPGWTEARKLEVVRSVKGPTGVVVYYQVLIPTEAIPGAGELQVVTPGQTFREPVFISAYHFGVFRETDAKLSAPAVRGGVVTLSGTGLGRLLPLFTPDMRAEVDGMEAQVVTSRPDPEREGVVRISVQVPAGARLGCYVPVVLIIGGTPTNMVTVPVGDGTGACPHPLGLGMEELRKLDAGGVVPVVSMGLSSIAGPDPGSVPWAPPFVLYKRWDAAAVDIWERDAAGVSLLFPPEVAEGCSATVSEGPAGAALVRVSLIDGSGVRPTVSGPALGPRSLPGVGVYRDLIQESPAMPGGVVPGTLIGGGAWTFARDQSDTMAAFRKTFAVPPPLRLRDRLRLSRVRRDEDLRVDWANDGYADQDVVTVRVEASSPASAFVAMCGARASAGRLTVPSTLLAEMPAEFAGASARVVVELRRRHDAAPLFRVGILRGGEAAGLFRYSWAESVAARVAHGAAVR